MRARALVRIFSQSIEGAPDRWTDQGSVGIISIGYDRQLGGGSYIAIRQLAKVRTARISDRRFDDFVAAGNSER
jgi:hypothetical protein